MSVSIPGLELIKGHMVANFLHYVNKALKG